MRIEYDDREVVDALRRLQEATGDLAPALRHIGEMLVDSTKRRFRDGSAPDGTPWATNAESTLLGHLARFRGSYTKSGRLSAKGAGRVMGKRPLIGETRSLSITIGYVVSGHTLEVGSPMEYAGTQQFGAARGAYGKDRHGRPIPWGDIPARPFLGLSDADRAELMEILREHLASATR